MPSIVDKVQENYVRLNQMPYHPCKGSLPIWILAILETKGLLDKEEVRELKEWAVSIEDEYMEKDFKRRMRGALISIVAALGVVAVIVFLLG